MHDGWMKSSRHQANILDDYTDVGIVFVTSGGTTSGVEVFARYGASGIRRARRSNLGVPFASDVDAPSNVSLSSR